MAPEMGSCDHSNEIFSSIESEKLFDSFKTISSSWSTLTYLCQDG